MERQAPLRQSTFRTSLQGELVDFLGQLGIKSFETAQAILELVIELSHYEEEGRALFPHILVCEKLSTSLLILNGMEPLPLGSGDMGPGTAQMALKKCAPLARKSWAIFIELQADRFAYGIFRQHTNPASISLLSTVASLPATAPAMFVLHQTARRTVELTSTGGRRFVVHVSAARTDLPLSSDALDELLDSVILDAAKDVQEPLRAFFTSNLRRPLVEGHGALIAVVPLAGSVPSKFTDDGIILGAPVELGPLLTIALRDQGRESAIGALSGLYDYATLIEGMLGSDGITVLRSDGALIGFNVFVKPPTEVADSLPSQLLGGARRRAFRVLCEMVDRRELSLAFIRSSNGSSDCRRGV